MKIACRGGGAQGARETDILLVEDDPAEVEVARRAFRRAQLDAVAVVRDGEEALAALRLEEDPPAECDGLLQPRVIFLDLRMPKVDGFEVLRAIRSAPHTREIPVVVVSSSSREEDVREAYRLGANSFLVKRFEGGPGAMLVDAARYWLELNRAPQPVGGK
jgi:two-component system response regulator